jgi:hypothetical protein
MEDARLRHAGMGRVLFIRVSVATFDEKDLLKAWPLLCACVWPDSETAGAVASGRKKACAPPALSPRGALELVNGLMDSIRFGDMPKEWTELLRAPSQRLEDLQEQLDEALGDRDVRKAQQLIDSIEHTLDEAEKAMNTIQDRFPRSFWKTGSA